MGSSPERFPAIGRMGAGEIATTPATVTWEATRNATAPPSECPTRIVFSGSEQPARDQLANKVFTALFRTLVGEGSGSPSMPRQIRHENAQSLGSKACRGVRHNPLVRSKSMKKDDVTLRRLSSGRAGGWFHDIGHQAASTGVDAKGMGMGGN